eukprot:TRINITY_DN2008_c0_g1_i1.p1 TRINITY_DN2008_c0_g1~~TRINITY_DN2008_c0_g1_i1.p1  ORF type:complete len:357 (-),score=124.44 TRINITY_DN2008_c0_g1_i1:95-1165(-)
MKGWGKMAIGAGALLLAGAFGYLRFKKKPRKRTLDESEVSSLPKDTPTPLLQLMEEVIVESLEQLYSCTENVQRLQKQRKSAREVILEKLHRSMDSTIGKIEEAVCAQNNWTLADYTEQIELRKAVNDPEVIARLDILTNFVNAILEGKRPEVRFEFDVKWTKPLGIACYRLILMSHLYISHKALHGRMAAGEKIDKKRYGEILLSINPEKECRRYSESCLRRNEIIRRTKVKAAGPNKYKYEFMKAFWTYRTSDKEFEHEVMETQKLCNLLKNELQQLAAISIFSKDPYEMTAEEFAKYYESAEATYLGYSTTKTSLSSPEESKAAEEVPRRGEEVVNGKKKDTGIYAYEVKINN